MVFSEGEYVSAGEATVVFSDGEGVLVGGVCLLPILCCMVLFRVLWRRL